MFRRTATSAKGRSFLHVIKLVSPFVMVVVLQAAIAGFSLEVMSSVRAYVAGEAMWSRSQKNAVYFLNLYLHSGEASQFAQYQASLAVPSATSSRAGHSSAIRSTSSSPASAFCKAATIPMMFRD